MVSTIMDSILDELNDWQSRNVRFIPYLAMISMTSGVKDIIFISMDGVSGLKEWAKYIFPDVVVQRCIVHLIRISIKYVPSKDYKFFTASLKTVYRASSLKTCKIAFEKFKVQWSQYFGAVAVWEHNFQYIEQLFQYGSAIRKVMYTTNLIKKY